MKNTLIAIFFVIFIISSDYFIADKFSIISSGLFFLLILFVTLFFRFHRVLYLLLFILGFMHHLFYSYFQRLITSTDIYLFFTHIEETVDSLFSMPSLFTVAFIWALVGLALLWVVIKIKTEPYIIKSWIKYPTLFTLIYLNLNSTMSLQLVDAFFGISFENQKNIIVQESPLYPVRESRINVVLLIGESMKYNAFVESKLKEQLFFYKKIYSGAINTDVSVPLLLNSKTDPLKLNNKNETNLFRLAKKSDFNTSFISIQTQNSLYYINKYLQREYIDHYKSYSKEERKPYFDFLLLENLDEIDFSQQSFIVMQQVGEHSPYKFFRDEASNTPRENYVKSIEYSFKLYREIYKRLIATERPFVFIYTSDHGEFTGEGGRYGHNIFDKIIYEVPMFIASNIELPKEYREIKSHYHISQFITYLLGYNKILKLSKEKSIVNGTMLSREDGFKIMP